MDEKKIMFELNKMEYDEKQIIDVPVDLDVTVDDFMFRKDMVSKIELYKFARSQTDEPADAMFVTFYSGNLRLGTVIYESDVVIDGLDDRFCYIRASKDYDYYDYE